MAVLGKQCYENSEKIRNFDGINMNFAELGVAYNVFCRNSFWLVMLYFTL